MGMDVICLGTGAEGTTPGLLVSAAGTSDQAILVNAGEGTQRLSSEHHLRLHRRVVALFVTRVATSALAGLPGFLLSLADAGRGSLTIYGPPGLNAWIQGMRAFIQRGPGLFVKELLPGAVIDVAGLRVTVAGGSAAVRIGDGGADAVGGDGASEEGEDGDDDDDEEDEETSEEGHQEKGEDGGDDDVDEDSEDEALPVDPSVRRDHGRVLSDEGLLALLSKAPGSTHGSEDDGVLGGPASTVQTRPAGGHKRARPAPDTWRSSAEGEGPSPQAPPAPAQRSIALLVAPTHGRGHARLVVFDHGKGGDHGLQAERQPQPVLERLRNEAVHFVGGSAPRAQLVAHITSPGVWHLPLSMAQGVVDSPPGQGEGHALWQCVLGLMAVRSGPPLAPAMPIVAFPASARHLDMLAARTGPARMGERPPFASVPWSATPPALWLGPAALLATPLLRFTLGSSGVRVDAGAVPTPPPALPGIPRPACLPPEWRSTVLADPWEAPFDWEDEVLSCVDNVSLLGTGAAQPSPLRSASSIMVTARGGQGSLLLDAGEGSIGQLMRKAFGQRAAGASCSCGERALDGASPVAAPCSACAPWLEIVNNVRIVFISHMHADHHCGLSRLLTEVSGDRRRPVLVGPPSLRSWLSTAAEATGETMLLPTNFSTCLAATTQPSRALWSAASSLGISQLTCVSVDHCRHAYGLVLDFGGGQRLVYSGDTRPCAALIAAGRGADLLIHEATFGEGDEAALHARIKRHCTIAEAQGVAARMGAARLIVTHLSQRFASASTPRPRGVDAAGRSLLVAEDMLLVTPSSLRRTAQLAEAVMRVLP